MKYLIIALLVGCAARATPSTTASRYPVPARVGTIVNDPAAFAKFAAAIRPDLGDTADHLFVRAMLDALDGNWPSALALLDRVVALEPDPLAKQMTGLTLRVLGDRGDPRAALEARVAALPIDNLREQLSMLRTMGREFSPEVCAKLVDDEVGPHVVAGSVTIDQAHAIVFQRYAVVLLVPIGKIIDEVLAAHGIEPMQ